MICRLCENNNLKLYYKQGNNDDYSFYICPECRLVNYDISCGLDQRKYGNVQLIDENEKKIKISSEQTYSFIKKHIHFRGKLIDIGCGTGELLYLAHNDGWDVKGLELSPVLVELIRSRFDVDVICADFLDYKRENIELYDVIVLRHVLEHLEDPVAAMKRINSMLSPDGYSVLEFPNIESPELKLKRFFQKTGLHKKKYKENFKPGHCNEFCKESFTYLLNKTGFDLIVWETYSIHVIANFIYNHFPIGNKARTIIKKTENL